MVGFKSKGIKEDKKISGALYHYSTSFASKKKATYHRDWLKRNYKYKVRIVKGTGNTWHLYKNG